MRSGKTKKRATPREFIEVWQKASSTTEVARKLNMTGKAIRQRVSRYSHHGVQLKPLPAIESWEWLAEHAKELQAKGGR
jgi:hypothetical protein